MFILSAREALSIFRRMEDMVEMRAREHLAIEEDGRDLAEANEELDRWQPQATQIAEGQSHATDRRATPGIRAPLPPPPVAAVFATPLGH